MTEQELEDLMIGEYIADGDMEVWERVGGGYIFRGEQTDGTTVLVEELFDEVAGPFVHLVPEVIVPEPKIATVADVKPGAVIEFVYTWKVTNGAGVYASMGEATVGSVLDWLQKPKTNCVAHVVKPAPDPIDEKVADLYEYAKDNNFALYDYQAEFFAKYLLSLESK